MVIFAVLDLSRSFFSQYRGAKVSMPVNSHLYEGAMTDVRYWESIRCLFRGSLSQGGQDFPKRVSFGIGEFDTHRVTSELLEARASESCRILRTGGERRCRPAP